jgi:hypothetical protein
MFLPSEAIYAELHARYANVIEQSFRERVFIVSPTTLWATLNTIRAIFRDVRIREQAGLLQKELHVLTEDMGRLDERVEKLAIHFRQTSKDIEDIQTSARKVSRRAEKITTMDGRGRASRAARYRPPRHSPRLDQGPAGGGVGLLPLPLEGRAVQPGGLPRCLLSGDPPLERRTPTPGDAPAQAGAFSDRPARGGEARTGAAQLRTSPAPGT